MKKISLALLMLIIVGIFIPAVSATILYDEEIDEYQFTGESYSISPDHGSYACIFNNIVFNNIESVSDLSYIAVTCPSGGSGRLPAGVHHQEYWFSDDINNKKPMTIYVSETKNFLGVVTSVRYTLFFDEWDIGTRTGAKTIGFNAIESSKSIYNHHPEIKQKFAYIQGDGTYPIYNFAISCGKFARNHITISDEEYGNTIKIVLKRVISGTPSSSYIKVFNSEDTVIYQDLSAVDLTEYFLKSDVALIELQTVYNHTYTIPLAGDQTGTSDAVTIYIRNSQTGALLANAHINISASVNGTLHEVVNETAPSGIYSIDLQPTGGGMPNPDYYRLWVTLDGYNSQMPYMDFEVSEGTSVYVYMEPTTGGPADENMTFVEFYVRDIYANPISGASVTCGGFTLMTNSAGYTQFEMPVNAAYPYSVTKTGYLTIEGIARVESDDRYVVNVALMAGVVPTHTAATPTITVAPTPTQTTPPIQEDNIIGLSVKGLAKGFGIDYDTALLLFGLMIVFGAGGIVMNSVKGGAMEFIAGSIVGTFVAFALGLIPIWIFIIIAVVFGAYVLRVFLQGER